MLFLYIRSVPQVTPHIGTATLSIASRGVAFVYAVTHRIYRVNTSIFIYAFSTHPFYCTQ